MKSGRIMVLTGPRQSGKTTLARRLFDDYEYISVEDPVMRQNYVNLTTVQWKQLYPNAILDEVQKEPVLIESIKSVCDQWQEPKYILLGSSQLLLMEKVRESLAGRCIINEIFPLTVPEINTNSWDVAVQDSLFQKEMMNSFTGEYLPSFTFDKRINEKTIAWDHYVKYGGYPAISDPEMSDEEKLTWLKNYVKTYLERDIRDLASFRDLDPFIKLQNYLALNTGKLINASSIAGQLGISAKTVQRYLRYFEISYQAIVLSAWSGNVNKRLVKMPKIHFLDNGVLQAVLKKKGGVTGSEFESLVIAEIYKQLKLLNINANFYHLRTHDGKEIDLLLEFADFFVAFEIKMAEKATKNDARNFDNLDKILNKPLKKAFILSNDKETKYFKDNIIALNVSMFLG
jgi:predicted AAA+ superfamily ATPase